MNNDNGTDVRAFQAAADNAGIDSDRYAMARTTAPSESGSSPDDGRVRP
ncbi:hypothetical protein [Embleya sp. NPDC001921]